MTAPNASTVPMKFLCIGNGQVGVAGPKSPTAYWSAACTRVTAANTLAVTTMSESASRA